MVTKIIRTVVIIIMCLFHDFPELDLTKVTSMTKVVTKVTSMTGTSAVLPTCYSIILWGWMVLSFSDESRATKIGMRCF